MSQTYKLADVYNYGKRVVVPCSCGGKPGEDVLLGVGFDFAVSCMKCGIDGPASDSMQGACSLWNQMIEEES